MTFFAIISLIITALQGLQNKETTPTGLDFAAGDYIDIDIDLSNCKYVYRNGTDAGDIGKDNILAIGTGSNLASLPANTILWYYPSIERMVPNPAEQGRSYLRFHAGRWAADQYLNGLDKLRIVFDKDGFTSNGVKEALTSAGTLYIGAEEGAHLSRATYDHISVVRYK